MTIDAEVGQLLANAFPLATADGPLAPLLSLAIRMAELRRDYINAWWLSKEAIGVENARARMQLEARMRGHFRPEDFEAMRRGQSEDLIERRTISSKGPDKVWGLPIAALDQQIASLEDTLRSAQPPPGLHPEDLYSANQQYYDARAQLLPTLQELRLVREKLRERVHNFLVETEAALAFSATASTTFERVRAFVDGQLARLAPDVLAQLQAAYLRSAAGDPEALAHAVTSCRRVLKTLADLVYPPASTPVLGSDGAMHAVTEDKLINRLVQFMDRPRDRASRLGGATVEGLAARLDALNDLSSKGVHAAVTESEVDLCVLETYIVVGEVLRVYAAEESPGPSDAI